MNLIEAWKKAKKGQEVSTPQGGIYKRSSLRELLTKDCFTEEELLAEDWEVVREKKVMVIESIRWKKNPKGQIFPWFMEDYPGFNVFDSLVDKPLMKMTLEWEE
jgi:hypothetical protein